MIPVTDRLEQINQAVVTANQMRNNLSRGDEIILSVMEHDSNIIPWQLVAQKTGAVLKFVELTETEEFNLEQSSS